MPKRLPENQEARYRIRIHRDKPPALNPASGHSDREMYTKLAIEDVINWANGTLPKSEAERIFEKYLGDLVKALDREELRNNNAEFRMGWGRVDTRIEVYEANVGTTPPKLIVQEWVAEEMEEIRHLPVPVPDKDLNLRWSRPIHQVAQTEIKRMADIREANLERAGIGRKQVATAEKCLVIVGATPAMTLGVAFNF